MTNDEIEKFVAEYDQKRPLYKDLSAAVRSVLEVCLKNDRYKYKADNREKDTDSLRKKLQKKTKADSSYAAKSLGDITDLAGCRILFYVESDIERFARTIHNEFEVLEHSDRYTDDGYNALHFIVRLKKERAALIEYAQFDGMVCEIQLTTILFHAWSEMEHDIVYKDADGLEEFDKRAYEAIRNRFKSVMKDHIKQASHDFEFIHKEAQRIKEGKRAFDAEFLQSIRNAADLNDMNQKLKLLAEYVSEFGDKTPQEFPIVQLMKETLERAETMKGQPIITPLGRLTGYGFNEIAKTALEILSTLRYWHTEGIFDLLVELSRSKNQVVKKQSLETLKRLTEYNLQIMKRAGYVVQKTISDRIQKWTEQELIRNFDALLVITGELLEPGFDGTEWVKENAVQFTSGPLSVNVGLKQIRQDTMSLLEKVFDLTRKTKEKLDVLHRLAHAMSTSHSGSSNEFNEIARESAKRIATFFVTLATRPENGLILHYLEEQAHWIKYRYGESEVPQVTELLKLLKANEEYQIFRVFFGRDGRFAPDFDHVKETQERKAKIDQFIKEVDASNFPAWRRRVLSILKECEPTERWLYAHMVDFLTEVAKRQPKLMIEFLQKDEKQLEQVRLDILSGIWQSDEKSAKRMLNGWIDADKYLVQCGFFFVYIKKIDASLFKKIFDKAKTKKDAGALNALVQSLTQNFGTYPDASAAFVELIRELTKHKNSWWVNYVWFHDGIIDNLDEKGMDVVLENLIFVRNVGYESEKILKTIAERYPLKVIKFFRTRISVEAKSRKRIFDANRYDAVPHNFHDLAEPLRKHADVVIPALLEWFNEKESKRSSLTSWDATHMISEIFPNFAEALETHMVALIEKQGIEAVDHILLLVNQYQGGAFLWNLCKEVVKRFHSHERYDLIKSSLFVNLAQSGVVSGEYGLAEAAEHKREDMRSWSDDGDPNVRKFLDEYAEYLEESAKNWRKRTDQEIAERQRRFDKRKGDE
jgi:ppGpp synthetase/RelA/SpoT-type nucleotidyltranferase